MLTVLLALVVFSLVMYYLYQQYAAPPLQTTPTIVLQMMTPTPTSTSTSSSPQTPPVTRVPTPAPQDVTVPDVAGMTLQEADDALRVLGLRLEVLDRQFSQTAAAGIVLSQTVRAQTKVQKDSVIGVTLSRGGQLVAVPRLVGLPYNDAVARLTAVGLKVQRIEVSAQGAPNAVVGQDPAENAQVQPNAVVKLTVSVGDVVTVPDTRGLSLEQGKDALLKAGLVIGQVSFQGKDKLPLSELVKVCVGCVLSTDPPTGRIVPRGTVINMGVRSE
jgi:beta-lactam-binding protein with PASTA domain